MTIVDLWSSSTASLARNKARVLLTMLGVVIGVASVILMLSVGDAARSYILGEISTFGSNELFIKNGAAATAGPPSPFVKQSLTVSDVRKLALEPWVTHITGELFQSDDLTAEGLDVSVGIRGVDADEINMSTVGVADGSFFDAADVDGHARVVVLGSTIAKEAFGQEEPVGKLVKLGTVGYKVVGVMQPAGSNSFMNADKAVFIPSTSALDQYNKQYLTFILVTTTFTNLDDAKARLQDDLRAYHSIDNPNQDLAKDDFNVTTEADALKTVGVITNILQILLVSIAAISLLVGGIGIMNIMYVAVTERTKEIGLRKSIGAKPADILSQFLVEAVVQTVLGGIIGIAIGIGLNWLGIQIINQFQGGWTFTLSESGILLGLTVSVGIGIVFGYFPARRAAKLSPIEALQKE
ncbi:MAG: ABC transporter permease [Patescibacteria group bacterium]